VQTVPPHQNTRRKQGKTRKQMNQYTILTGDCLEQMRKLPDCSVDSIVTDPPYGLSFMGKAWDYDVPQVDVWRECLRVLKHGGHLLAFAGTRTQHRMAVNIEDAGFEIRDMIAWVYGSGFPKSLDVSKAIDKAAGAEREVIGVGKGTGKQNPAWNGIEAGRTENSLKPEFNLTVPATEAAKKWQGWGTALKPALEPITVARKPLAKGMTVAANVLAHGTGAINVDGCRVGTRTENESGWSKTGSKASENRAMSGANYDRDAKDELGTGRWPANLIHDGSDEVVGLFPVTAVSRANKVSDNRSVPFYQAGDCKTGGVSGRRDPSNSHNDNGGSAARFFKECQHEDASRFKYCAKASKADRDAGCEGIEERMAGMSNGAQLNGEGYDKGQDIGLNRVISRRNFHPTVKPTDLMRYLVRLVTPPNGTVLDPFMGSGSTGKAAVLEGFQFIGCELNPEYVEIAIKRIDAASKQHKQQEIFT
jgi:site-specific DNA-methyltransferase (adenine-specific)